jgi:hypothetical protein
VGAALQRVNEWWEGDGPGPADAKRRGYDFDRLKTFLIVSRTEERKRQLLESVARNRRFYGVALAALVVTVTAIAGALLVNGNRNELKRKTDALTNTQQQLKFEINKQKNLYSSAVKLQRSAREQSLKLVDYVCSKRPAVNQAECRKSLGNNIPPAILGNPFSNQLSGGGSNATPISNGSIEQ